MSRIEKSIQNEGKLIKLDLEHIAEIDSGIAEAIKTSFNYAEKSGTEAVICNANVS